MRFKQETLAYTKQNVFAEIQESSYNNLYQGMTQQTCQAQQDLAPRSSHVTILFVIEQYFTGLHENRSVRLNGARIGKTIPRAKKMTCIRYIAFTGCRAFVTEHGSTERFTSRPVR